MFSRRRSASLRWSGVRLLMRAQKVRGAMPRSRAMAEVLR